MMIRNIFIFFLFFLFNTTAYSLFEKEVILNQIKLLRTVNTMIQQVEKVERKENKRCNIAFSSMFQDIGCCLDKSRRLGHPENILESFCWAEDAEDLAGVTFESDSITEEYFDLINKDIPELKRKMGEYREALYKILLEEVPIDSSIDFEQLCKEYEK